MKDLTAVEQGSISSSYLRLLSVHEGAVMQRSSLDASKTGGDAFGEVFFTEGVENRIECAFNYAIKRVESEVDSMVGHAVLREIVGPDAL